MHPIKNETLTRQPIMVEQKSGSNGADKHSIINQIGNTPLLELERFSRQVAPVRIFAKAEWFNAGGSVKDRTALNMILEAEKTNELTTDKTILDASSGNTGIALAMIGSVFSYKVKLVIPENAGSLFKQILNAYNAELIFSDAQLGSDGAIQEARRIYRQNPSTYFYADQYHNPANWQAHYKTTAPEIIRQTNGKLTHFIAGIGTGGTFVGTSRRLQDFNPDIKVISVQPDSPFHGLEGMKHIETAIVPGFFKPDLADQNLETGTETAQNIVKELAAEEGLLVGLSAGAAAAAALEVAKNLPSGLIVIIFADSAHKYLDQRFWQEN